MELDVKTALVVHPGDTVIVCVQASATREQVAAMRDQMLDLLPGVADVVIVAGADIAAYRPQEG